MCMSKPKAPAPPPPTEAIKQAPAKSRVGKDAAAAQRQARAALRNPSGIGIINPNGGGGLLA